MDGPLFLQTLLFFYSSKWWCPLTLLLSPDVEETWWKPYCFSAWTRISISTWMCLSTGSFGLRQQVGSAEWGERGPNVKVQRLVAILVGNGCKISLICWVVVSKIFYFHPYVGKWSNFDWYFSDGLKPPTSMIYVTKFNSLWTVTRPHFGKAGLKQPPSIFQGQCQTWVVYA